MKTRYLDIDDRTNELRLLMRKDSQKAREFLGKFDCSLIYHENALEGIVFSSVELLAALDPNAVAADASLVPVFTEIRNHKAALEEVRKEARDAKSRITVTLMKKLYEILGTGIEGREKANYRRDMPLHRTYFHDIAQPPRIPIQLEKLVDFTTTAEYREMHPVHQAATVQYMFMQAFPFTDNSGKVARLLSHLGAHPQRVPPGDHPRHRSPAVLRGPAAAGSEPASAPDRGDGELTGERLQVLPAGCAHPHAPRLERVAPSPFRNGCRPRASVTPHSRGLERLMLLGAHQAIGTGIAKVFELAEADKAECLQIFTKNARGWVAKPLDPEAVTQFRAETRRSGLPVVAHCTYLVNLASEDEEIRKKSVAGFTDELTRCGQLGVPWLVLHPGAHADAEVGTGLIQRGLEHAFTRVAESGVLLEVTAGQGVSIGHTFEQLARLFDGSKHPERLGLCLDTCHLYAAGYDIRSADAYAATMAQLEKLIGLDRVKAVHLNDCKKELGCRVDRHEDIGKGTLGLEAFRPLVGDRRLKGALGILETPTPEKYKASLAKLRQLRDEKAKSSRVGPS